MTDMPPPRWKVVERGRRLEVIDTRAPASPDGETRGPATLMPRKSGFDGRAVLTTRRAYDEKAPRTLQLDAGSAALVDRVRMGVLAAALALVVAASVRPWSIPIVVVLIAQGRKPLRAAITRWLDRLDRAAS